MGVEKLNKKYGKNYEIVNGFIVKKRANKKIKTPKKVSDSSNKYGNEKTVFDLVEQLKIYKLAKKMILSPETTNWKFETKEIIKKSAKICDFYIKSVTFITKFKVKVFFKVKYKNKTGNGTVVIPYEYYNNPDHWVKRYMPDCHNLTSIDEFNRAIIEITNNLTKNKKSKDYFSKTIGWEVKKYQNEEDDLDLLDATIGRYIYIFDCHNIDDYPKKAPKEEKRNRSLLLHCIDNKDLTIGLPLVAYLLYSLLLRPFKDSTSAEPNTLIFSLTGGRSERQRNQIALFFNNVFKRDVNAVASRYKNFHIFPEDTASKIDYKSLRLYAGVMIAFNPTKGQALQLKRLFAPIPEVDYDDYEDIDPVPFGTVLIVKDDVKDIPYKTINLTVPDDYKISAIAQNFQTSKKCDYLMFDLNNYANYLAEKMAKKDINYWAEYRKYESYFEESYPRLCEDALDAASRLCFAIEQYLKYAKSEEFISKDEYKYYSKTCVTAIINVISESFHRKNDILISTKQQALEICRAIDQHLALEKNKSKICNIGSVPTAPSLAQVWCDGETINITTKNIEEILKLQNCKYKFNIHVKKALAELGLIQTTVRSGGTNEYSLHIQKPLYDDFKTSERFIRFKRDACLKHKLFENLECVSMDHVSDDVTISKPKELLETHKPTLDKASQQTEAEYKQ